MKFSGLEFSDTQDGVDRRGENGVGCRSKNGAVVKKTTKETGSERWTLQKVSVAGTATLEYSIDRMLEVRDALGNAATRMP